MAMSKEEQKAASDRIMAKHPLTPEEQRRYKMLTKVPEEYDVPGEKRVCGVCGAVFRDTVNHKGEVEVAMLDKFADHQASHNPSPDQWKTAHERIQQGKEAAKSRT
jgi:hypothetical protein